MIQQQPQQQPVDYRKAQAATLELQALLAGNHSLDSLTADYYKAKDEVDQLKTAAAAAARTKAARDARRDSLETPKRNGKQSDDKKSPMLSGKVVSSDTFSFGPPKEQQQQHHHEFSSESQWDFWIENLSHISSYQIVLRPKTNSQGTHVQQQSIASIADRLEISVTRVGQEKSMVLVRTRSIPNKNNEDKAQPIFCAKLLGKIQSQPSSFQIGQDSLHIQLKYDDDIMEQHLIQESTAILHKTNVAHLACKSCRQRVVRTDTEITRVVPMPSSNWDEIADYLICYSGVSTRTTIHRRSALIRT
jgi:HECT-like Ubiquitin-conjugating enzyme (E2)-binding